MKKYMIIILSLFLIFLNLNIATASDSDETSVNKLYNKFLILMYPQTDNALKRFVEMPEAIDLAIEILREAPGSFEAYGAMAIFRESMEYHEETIKKYKELKDKYMPLLDDMENDMAEKLILLRLMYLYDPGASEEEAGKDFYKCLRTLIKIKNECKNKDYAALALSCFFATKIVGQDPVNEFIQKYPVHPAIPEVKLEKTIKTKKVDEAIEEINKLCEQYGQLPRPHGGKFEIECYWALVNAYFVKDDKITARKYFEMIKKEMPNHPALFDLSQCF